MQTLPARRDTRLAGLEQPGGPGWPGHATDSRRGGRPGGVPGLARRLAVSVRHLHRLLVEGVGAPPLALARSQRAYHARLLVETTKMPFSEIAFAAGFASIRQFNETLRQVFAATPSELRATRRPGVPQPADGLALRLPARMPYDLDGVLRWLAGQAIPGVEEFARGAYRRVLQLPGGPGTVTLRPEPGYVQATFRLATLADLGAAVARCRRLLDLDADPQTYLPVLAADPALAPLTKAVPGLRLPGTVDAAETALRTVLGPQAAARAAALGEPLPAPDGALTHAFPDPATVAVADPATLRLSPSRGRTVHELAKRLANGELVVNEGANRTVARGALLAIPGIGSALAEQLGLSALADPDAFPASDPRLCWAARRQELPGNAVGLARHARQWRPWRGYAAHLLWHPRAALVTEQGGNGCDAGQ